MKPISLMRVAVLALFATLGSTGLGAQAHTATEPLELYHEINGEGPPLVLLHGAFMTIDSNWRSSLAELGKSNKVIAVELQGHGRTPDRDAPLSYEQMADDVARLLEELDVGKASLLGYSMGANVALQLALRHPDKVERLVVVSPSASDTGLDQGHKDMVRHLSPEMFAGTPVVADYQRLSPRPDFPALVEKIRQIELTSYDWSADLSRIKSPVLIVGGDADVVTLGHLASMHAAMGGVAHGDINGPSQTQLMVLPATTHMGVIADPAKLQAVIAAATAFLAAPAQK